MLRKSELANELWPGNPDYVATLGKCQYTAGRFQAARRNLGRAEKLRGLSESDADAEHLAFLAMTDWRLGQSEEALETMRQLDSLTERRDEEFGFRVLASISEARALIEAAR